MSYYTLTSNLIVNSDSKCVADLLYKFAQTNNLKACIDSKNIIIDEYGKIINEHKRYDIKMWLDCMANNNSFVKVNIDPDNLQNINEVFLKVCSNTKSSQKLIVDSYQEIDNISEEDGKFYTLYDNRKIQIFEKSTAVLEVDSIVQKFNDCYKKPTTYSQEKPDDKFMDTQNNSKFNLKSIIIGVITLLLIIAMTLSFGGESELSWNGFGISVNSKEEDDTSKKIDDTLNKIDLKKINIVGRLLVNNVYQNSKIVDRIYSKHDSFAETKDFDEGRFYLTNVTATKSQIITLIIDFKNGTKGISKTIDISNATNIRDNVFDLGTIEITFEIKNERNMQKMHNIKINVIQNMTKL